MFCVLILGILWLFAALFVLHNKAVSLLGTDDWQTPSALAAEYFEKIDAPIKKLYWVENAAHATDLDNPVDFYSAIKEIIESMKI